MRRLYVFIRLWDRNIEVQIKGEDCTRNEHHEDGESCILEVCNLDFHGSELDAPADVVSRWRRLEADMLPICGLEVFEVVGFGKIQLFKVFGEYDDWVPDEEMGEVSCEEGVHTAIHKMLLDIGINDEVWVEVFFS